ncbi:MAG: stage III sporulation protein AB [Clostridia bacterium]|nr:stage III sporulation protein AB [Clostridia bacterium]
MKIAGCILIFISAILCSYYYEKGLKIKISKCEELLSFINYIKSQIDYFSLPISTIYEKYDKKSDFINEIISSENGIKAIDKENDQQINEFFGNIGKGFKKEQIKLCEYNIDRFSNLLEKLKNDYPNKAKVFRSMSLFFGICAIILLV